jgi:hypothetical protein
MKKHTGLAVVVVMVTGCLVANGARPVTEAFASGFSGWIMTNRNIEGAWVNVDSQAEFDLWTPEIPVPGASCTLIASNGASSGAFVGDWNAAGIDCLNFDFIASCTTNPVNTQIVVSLYGGNSKVDKVITTSSLESLQHFSVSVESKAQGGWAGSLTEEAFSSMKTNIRSVAIRATVPALPTTKSQFLVYRFDNISLDSQARMQGLASIGNDSLAINWSHLVADRIYTLETCNDLAANVWSNASTFSATGTVSTVSISNASRVQFMRLKY